MSAPAKACRLCGASLFVTLTKAGECSLLYRRACGKRACARERELRKGTTTR